jgi:hypothetical protein
MKYKRYQEYMVKEQVKYIAFWLSPRRRSRNFIKGYYQVILYYPKPEPFDCTLFESGD